MPAYSEVVPSSLARPENDEASSSSMTMISHVGCPTRSDPPLDSKNGWFLVSRPHEVMFCAWCGVRLEPSFHLLRKKPS